MRGLLTALLLAAPAFAGEYAVLSNGFRIYADRHETDGAVTRLYSGNGSAQFQTSQIVDFEAEDYVEPLPPTPALLPPPELSAKDLLGQAAIRNGLPPAFLLSVAAAESGFRQDVISRKGAVGIMQLMPATAKAFHANPADPEQNVDAGARYLRQLLLKYLDDPYQVRKALAAYSAGPEAVDRYGGVPPYPETVDYVRKVIQGSGR